MPVAVAGFNDREVRQEFAFSKLQNSQMQQFVGRVEASRNSLLILCWQDICILRIIGSQLFFLLFSGSLFHTPAPASVRESRKTRFPLACDRPIPVGPLPTAFVIPLASSCRGDSFLVQAPAALDVGRLLGRYGLGTCHSMPRCVQ